MKKAFTLAEVLITLGIIGVVAALTIPTVIASYRKQEASARTKKFYSTIQQAFIMSESEFGPSNEWEREENAKKNFMKYLAPYMNYSTITDEDQPTVYFADGSLFELKDGGCLDFNFDVNGMKLPNKNGIDRFYFPLCFTDSQREFWHGNPKQAFGTYEGRANTREEALILCKNSPSYCSRLLQIDDWEIKKDFPQKF